MGCLLFVPFDFFVLIVGMAPPGLLEFIAVESVM